MLDNTALGATSMQFVDTHGRHEQRYKGVCRIISGAVTRGKTDTVETEEDRCELKLSTRS